MGTMMRIGLTGGIAAGKSTVAARLKQLGALHIDYDALAHQIVEPGGVALPQIVAEFGPDALLADGTMNRPWIADHVFGANAAPGMSLWKMQLLMIWMQRQSRKPERSLLSEIL